MPTVDGLKMTIPLREGVKFNDGTPMDAASVVKSLERHRTLEESRRAGELGSVASVAAEGTNAVVLTLSKPDSALTGALSDRAGMIMSPAKLDELGTDFGNFPVCVGPFSFVERVVGDHTTLERSEHYYDADTVYLDRLIYRPIADETVRTANLRSGDLQLLDRVATTDVAGLEGDAAFVVAKKVSNAYTSLYVNLANANGITGEPGTVTNPLADPKLREAFDLALDREQINEIVYTGLQEPGCGPISPASPFYTDPGCPTRDVEAAKRLVAESGVATPIHVRFNMQSTPVNTRLGELIQTQTAEAGFEVELIPLDNTAAFQNAERWGLRPHARSLVRPGRPRCQHLPVPPLDRLGQLREAVRSGDRRTAPAGPRGVRSGGPQGDLRPGRREAPRRPARSDLPARGPLLGLHGRPEGLRGLRGRHASAGARVPVRGLIAPIQLERLNGPVSPPPSP